MKIKKQILLGVIIGIITVVLILSYHQTAGTVQSPSPTLIPPQAEKTSLPQPTINSVTPTPIPQNSPTSSFRPGSLLTNENHQRIYYIAANGAARRLESWMTFYAFGFPREAALTIDDATLDQIPSSDPLTPHLYDNNNYHYWAINGSLWAIDAWQSILTAPTYRGIPSTPADSLLLASMPVVKTIPDDILLRDGVKLYVKQGGIVYPVVSSSVYQAFGYEFNQAAEIPPGALAEYDSKKPLTQFLQNGNQLYEIVEGQRRPLTLEKLIASGYTQDDVRVVADSFARAFPLAETALSLRVNTSAVNLRQGPGTGYQKAGQVSANDTLLALGRTPDNSWLKVRYQEKTAWVAASVVDLTGEVENLPIIEAVIIYATATPKATSTVTLLTCNDVPIRGFGKVWADHPEIQSKLGCSARSEQAIQVAVQQFQHGFMAWVEVDNLRRRAAVYVFFDDNTYQRFDPTRVADPATVGSIPSGFYPINDKFSAIYWEGTGARIKERLVYATTPAQDSAGAFQPFSHGRMFWLETIKRIFVVYDYPGGWDNFEDKF